VHHAHTLSLSHTHTHAFSAERTVDHKRAVWDHARSVRCSCCEASGPILEDIFNAKGEASLIDGVGDGPLGCGVHVTRWTLHVDSAAGPGPPLGALRQSQLDSIVRNARHA
jgi:hypothetical protein